MIGSVQRMLEKGFAMGAVAGLLIAGCTLRRAPDMPERAAMVLAERERALAEIVLPVDPSFLEQQAAEELRAYLRRITGADFRIVSEGREKAEARVFVGRTKRALAEFGERLDVLGKEGFLLSNDGTSMVIIGGGDYGTLYGAYELLEKYCGVRWYAPGDLGEIVPRCAMLSLPGFREEQRPRFEMRWVGKDTAWNLRNKMNRVIDPDYPPAFRVVPSIYHSQYSLLPVKEYFPQHPEYFALIDGKRCNDRNAKLCYSNPEVAHTVAERMAELLRSDLSISLISFSPSDGQFWCDCEGCRAMDEPDVAADQRYSRRSLIFYNKLAELLEREFPDQPVLVGAYNVYTQPPLDPDLRAHPNLRVIVTHYDEYCMAHPVDDPDCPLNAKFRALLSAWQDRGVGGVYFYEYYRKVNWLNLPWPIVHSISRDIPYFASIGTRGLFTQYSLGDVWTNLLDYYVAAKLLWDPDTDVRALLEEFYRLFYGPAAEPMRAYYEALEDAMANCGRHFPGNALRNAGCFLIPELMKRLGGYLRQAEELATGDTTGIVEERVAKVRTSYNYTHTFMDYIWTRDMIPEARNEEEFNRAMADAEGKFGQLVEYLQQEEENLEGIVTIRHVKRRLRYEEEDFRQHFSPERTEAQRLGLVNEWFVIGPFSNEDWKGHSNVYGPEREINLEAGYAGKGGRQIGWCLLRNQPWDGYVDLSHFFDGEEWAVAYALCWVETTNPVRAQLRLGSNDSVIAWIGSYRALDRQVARAAKMDEDVVDVELPAGRTPILLKIGQSSLDWGFYFRITDHDGQPLRDIRFSTQP